jgi:uncharacterized membrane protein (UPF0127 family)
MTTKKYYKTKRHVIIGMIFSALIIIISGFYLTIFLLSQFRNFKIISLNSQPIIVELAVTPNQWKTGLSKRSNLCPDCGMLFIFPDKQKRSFWMNKMNFPLDIIWFSDNEVVGISSNLPAPKSGEEPIIAESPKKVNFVLEINANQSVKFGLKIGQKFKFLRVDKNH